MSELYYLKQGKVYKALTQYVSFFNNNNKMAQLKKTKPFIIL